MTKIIGAPTLDDALSALGSVAAANEARGERTIVFCEDRLTLLAERAVLPAGGTFLTEVTSFARFLRSDTRVLSKHGSILEFSSLLASLKEELVCFGASAAQAVYETVAQLFASRVAPAMLRESAERAEGVLRFKLLDLALLYEKYEEFLSERGLLDENGYLALLPERLGAAVAEVNVVFFAFTSFTRQAQEGIRAAIGNARSVAGIFLAGRSAYYTNEAARVFRSVAEEFEKPEIRQLKSSLEGEAALLQAHLFSPDAPSERAPARSVFGFSAADEAEEMNTVAAIIRKKTAEGMRYRDFSVLVGDKSYFLPALKAFEAHGIPFYADKKRAYAEHPFCAFALSALEAVSSPEAADDVAASVYFGDGGEYRNYLIKLVGRGAVRREIPQDIPAPLRGKLEACRQKMLSILALFRPKDRGAAYADGVAKLYELVDGENVTSALQKAVGGEEAAFLETKRLWDILEETKEIVGERTFTAREFSALLKSGLEGAEVSMLPRSRDAVFVGDITESRVARCPVVFAAGLTDEVPRVCHDTAVITDREIGRLKELRVEIEPAIAVVNARAKEAPALNLCAFTQELYLSCPARKGGAECAPSEILSLVRQLFTLQELPPLFPYTCTRYGPALLAYFEGCDEAEGWKTSQNAERLAAECSTLREALKGGVFGHGAIVDPEEVRRREKPAVSEAGELYFGRAVSPTLLEDWFECPYKSFAMRALRVSEQDERALLGSADAGTFVHTVLERTAKRFHEFSGEEECRAHTLAVAEELLGGPPFSSLTGSAAGTYTAGCLKEEAAAVAVAAYRQLVRSDFCVRATEAEIELPKLKMKGKADRVDEAENCVRIIDYKTGNIDDSPVAYYTGRKLQTQLYLLAASQGKRAAAAFYFPAADDFTRPEDREGKFRMKGFYCSDEDVVRSLDPMREEGKKSEFFESGSRSDKGMPREEFEDFLAYSEIVAEQAEREMRAGNIRPSPYEGACEYCKLLGMCAFSGAPRKEEKIGCKEIAAIARAKGEET